VEAARHHQAGLRDFDEGDVQSVDPKGVSGSGPSPSDPIDYPSWEAEVQRFLEWKRTETSVGENWIRRMRWELNRVPELLEKVGATPVAHTGSGSGLYASSLAPGGPLAGRNSTGSRCR
jgi:hypothetical protein